MSNLRKQQAQDFLQLSGWGEARCEFLSGDASFRSYQRVTMGEKTAVLMDAPPEKEPLPPFIQMTEYLTSRGYSAPRILAKNMETGFLLLEDLGDDLFSRVLKQSPAREASMYLEAVNLLVDLHQHQQAVPAIADYDVPLLLNEAALFTDWYLPAVLGAEKAAALRTPYLALWQGIFDKSPWLPSVVVLRDFHADNLLWLPQREGIHRIGLLDYQDAVMGSPAYDLVSLIEDARRDVQPETAMTALNHYIQQMQWDADTFRTLYAILGAQRNLKIIGIFTRLAVRDGKFHYLPLLPRVWNHLMNDLDHSILKPLRQWIEATLPEEHQRGIPNIQPPLKTGGNCG